MDDREEPHGTGSARDFIPVDESLPVLRDAVQRCQGCGLYAFATQAVILRAPDEISREHEFGEFVKDLRAVAERLRELG